MPHFTLILWLRKVAALAGLEGLMPPLACCQSHKDVLFRTVQGVQQPYLPCTAPACPAENFDSLTAPCPKLECHGDFTLSGRVDRSDVLDPYDPPKAQHPITAQPCTNDPLLVDESDPSSATYMPLCTHDVFMGIKTFCSEWVPLKM